MADKAPIFEKIYQDYLAQINRLDLRSLAQKMGVEWTGKELIVPLFGIPYQISAKKILDPSGREPIHSVKVLLSRYLLMYPEKHPEDNTSWVSYRDFKDAAPLANTFHVNTEIGIANTFQGKLQELKKAGLQIGGYNYSAKLNYDLHIKFDALPSISILFLFNDSDDEFPAECLLLFERHAKYYLDMECLAILGWLLAEKLKGKNI